MVAQWSAFWGVNCSSIERWRRNGAPFQDPEAFAKWCTTRKHVPAAVVAKLKELGLSTEQAKDGSPEWKVFIEGWAAGGFRPHKGVPESVSKLCHYYAFRTERAAAAGDGLAEKLYATQHREYENTIRQMQLAADKLGMESGEIITRQECERLIAALEQWRCVATSEGIASLAASLCSMQSMTPAAASALVERWLIDGAWLKPFRRATRATTQLALPPWAFEAMRREHEQYISTQTHEPDFHI